MSSYHACVGPESGTVMAGSMPDAIRVHEGDSRMPAGMALGQGWDDQGRQLWRLVIRGEKLPGRWLVVARRFMAAAVDG